MSLVDLNYNFECDWFVELSDNKLSDNKLSDNNLASELVGNRSFFKSIAIKEIVIFIIIQLTDPFYQTPRRFHKAAGSICLGLQAFYRAVLAHWWDHSSSTNVAQVRFCPRRYTRAEFVGSLLCSEGFFFPGYSGSPFTKKTNIWFDL